MRAGATADGRGQRFACAGAAGDSDLADALRAQMFGGQRADLAGADDQHAPAFEAPEDLARQRDRR